MLGEPILRLDECDSTNRVALDWADAPDGAAVVARSQTSGRGRLGRSWESAPDKGLYFSLVLYPLKRLNWTFFSPLTALSLVKSLESRTDLRLAVKWPNDLICLSKTGEARKIGGILCESKGERLIVGIGINLNQEAHELPRRALFPASSLRLESGDTYNLPGLLNSLLPDLDADYELLKTQGWSYFQRDFANKCLGIGEVVSVKIENESLIGVFEGIDKNGALVLQTANEKRAILAGDVSYF